MRRDPLGLPLATALAHARLAMEGWGERRPRRPALYLPALAALLLSAGAAQAQPFGSWINLDGTLSGVTIPASPALNPTGAITIEGWVIFTSTASCTNIIGKNYVQAWWVGVCSGFLRSYVQGSSSLFDAGKVPVGQWTHFAVTYDGSTWKHYINGELAGSRALSGPLTTSSSPVQIGNDAAYVGHTPHASFNEFRLWNVARTIDQIRATINVPLTSPQTGLVAVWGLEAGPGDALGGHNGTFFGSVTGSTFAVTLTCGSTTPGFLCLDGHFAISVSWRVGASTTGSGTTVSVSNPGSGLFWFFAPSNWEVMVKVIDACGLNNRFWVFSAATTNVFYRMEVRDVRAGVNKVYFNYPGPPAPAVTDTDAFATCP